MSEERKNHGGESTNHNLPQSIDISFSQKVTTHPFIKYIQFSPDQFYKNVRSDVEKTRQSLSLLNDAKDDDKRRFVKNLFYIVEGNSPFACTFTITAQNLYVSVFPYGENDANFESDTQKKLTEALSDNCAIKFKFYKPEEYGLSFKEKQGSTMDIGISICLLLDKLLESFKEPDKANDFIHKSIIENADNFYTELQEKVGNNADQDFLEFSDNQILDKLEELILKQYRLDKSHNSTEVNNLNTLLKLYSWLDAFISFLQEKSTKKLYRGDDNHQQKSVVSLLLKDFKEIQGTLTINDLTQAKLRLLETYSSLQKYRREVSSRLFNEPNDIGNRRTSRIIDSLDKLFKKIFITGKFKGEDVILFKQHEWLYTNLEYLQEYDWELFRAEDRITRSEHLQQKLKEIGHSELETNWSINAYEEVVHIQKQVVSDDKNSDDKPFFCLPSSLFKRNFISGRFPNKLYQIKEAFLNDIFPHLEPKEKTRIVELEIQFVKDIMSRYDLKVDETENEKKDKPILEAQQLQKAIKRLRELLDRLDDNSKKIKYSGKYHYHQKQTKLLDIIQKNIPTPVEPAQSNSAQIGPSPKAP